MSTESITRKKLPDITATDVRFALVVDNLIFLDYSAHGEDQRISFRLTQIDMAVAKAKVKASESTMTDDEKRTALEDYARNQPKPDFDPQDNF